MNCTKISLHDVEAISNRGGNLKILISPKTSTSAHLVMGYSKLKNGEELKRHIHDYSDEVFFVLNGSGLLRTNEGDIKFKQFDAVHVPKKTTHTIINNGDQDMEVIFCVSPLAPSPELGHRELDLSEGEYHHA